MLLLFRPLILKVVKYVLVENRTNDTMRLGGLGLVGLLGLEVLVGEVGDETTNGDNAVEAKAAAGGGRADGGRVGGGGLGDRVAGLRTQSLVDAKA